jgi:glycosyltransferase involved in cell wall biosynthesis
MSNVLLVGNWPSDTGYAWWLMESFWLAIAKRYRREGRRILLCYPKVNGVNPQLLAAGIEVLEFNFDVEAPAARLAAFVRQHGVRYLYLTDKKYVTPTYASLRRAGVKGIVIHDHTPGDRTRPTGLKRVLKTIMARLPGVAADAYVAVSPLVVDRFRQVACLPAAKCHLATNGIDLDAFNAAQALDIRAELGLPADALVLVSCGRATRYKGIHRIIEAAALVVARHGRGRIAFLHCGDGPDLEEFQRMIREHRLEGSFFLLGRRNDVSGILKSANVAIHASEGEALSLAILEFMAARLPVVLPDSPTVAQTVEDQKSGVLYKPGDAGDLAEKLTRLIESPLLRASLGEEARRAVEERYTLRGTIKALLRAVEHTIPH